MLLGTCPCAAVRCVLCALSGFAAPGGRCCLAPVRVPWLWPAVCLSGVPRGPAWCAAPRPVRSLSVLRSAFPTPWCLSPPRGLTPPALLGGCTGHAEAGRELGSMCLPLAPAEAGALGSLASYPFGAPRWGCPWRVAPASVLGCVRCGGWRVWTRSLTRPVSRTVHRSMGDSAAAPGAVSCGRRHLPLRVGGRHAWVPCVCACACSFWPGQAGRPPGRVLVRLTFSIGRFVFLLCLAPSGLGLPLSWSFAFAFFFFVFPILRCFFFPCALFVSCLLSFPAPGALGLGALCCWFCWPRASWLTMRPRSLCVARPLAPPRWLPPPTLSRCWCRISLPCAFFFLSAPPLSPAFFVSRPRVPWALALCFVCFSRSPAARLSVCSRSSLAVAAPTPHLLPLLCLAFFVAPAWCLGVFFFFFFLCAPPLSPAFSGFRPRVPWASALCVVCFVGLPLLGSPCALSSFVLSAWPLAAPGWLLPPPPPLCLAVFVAADRCCVPCAVLLCLSLSTVLRRAAARCAARCCAVVCCVALLCSFGAAACCAVTPGAARRFGALCSAALCFAVFPPAVCSVRCVFCRGAVVRAVVRRSASCCAVCSPSPPLCAVLCFALLVRLRCAVRVVRAVAGAWCCGALLCVVLFPLVCCGAVLGLVARGCLLVACFRCRCPCLATWSASLWLVWFAVVPCSPVSCSVVLCCRMVLCCCALLSCCCADGACFAHLWPVVLCCVVLLVGCAVFCPVVVSACCGALSLVLCAPCVLRSVRCGALLCWLWCPSSLCRVLWRCAVVWCCSVVLCCRFVVLFLFALPSCGPSCDAVLCRVVLLVVCAVYCPVVACVCCGALSLPAGTHKKHQSSYMSPRVGGGVVAGMPLWLRCPGLDAAYVPPAAKGR